MDKLLHKIFFNKFVIEPDGNLRFLWDMIVLIILIYNMFYAPFAMAFSEKNDTKED